MLESTKNHDRSFRQEERLYKCAVKYSVDRDCDDIKAALVKAHDPGILVSTYLLPVWCTADIFQDIFNVQLHNFFCTKSKSFYS